jgi:hypothetical protein
LGEHRKVSWSPREVVNLMSDEEVALSSSLSVSFSLGNHGLQLVCLNASASFFSFSKLFLCCTMNVTSLLPILHPLVEACSQTGLGPLILNSDLQDRESDLITPRYVTTSGPTSCDLGRHGWVAHAAG